MSIKACSMKCIAFSDKLQLCGRQSQFRIFGTMCRGISSQLWADLADLAGGVIARVRMCVDMQCNSSDDWYSNSSKWLVCG